MQGLYGGKSLERIVVASLSLLLDGLSFGMILFLISSGLTVTLGVMRVINLAHCGFAMAGGYMAMTLMQSLGLGLFAAAPLAVAGTVLLGLALERTVYRWVYGTNQLGQILMTIGLAFVMVAATNRLFGPLLHTLRLPAFLTGTWSVADVTISIHRSFLVLLSGAIAGALWYGLERTRFGAALRAAVNNPSMARAIGINVRQVFAITFAVGCGLAAIGGIFGTPMLPLEPDYALRYLVLVLIVVAVGGPGSLRGSFLAALALGLIDTYGRYLMPAVGGFVIYGAVVSILLVRPQGLFGRP
ncbi:MAG: branched-chain amino acid ABC transporter permease [Proteobacteria bacterium]|nr:branched-chain amino acid ABC transporter permease [Pseudomonadota bacterium]